MNTEPLKRALARMLPDTVGQFYVPGSNPAQYEGLYWKPGQRLRAPILDTELLALVREVELGLNDAAPKGDESPSEFTQYLDLLLEGHRDDGLRHLTTADWQPRVAALAKVKGIEV